jgi:hypothetical protein
MENSILFAVLLWTLPQSPLFQPIAPYLDFSACSKPDDIKVSVLLYDLHFPDYPVSLNNIRR